MSFVNDIAGGVALKSVETLDKSAPQIDTTVKIGANPFTNVTAEITQPHELKHVDTIDKSAPAIDANVHIKENQHNALLQEIAAKTSFSE